MNLQTEYAEENAANAGTIDLLEVETSQRVRLEKELNELRVRILTNLLAYYSCYFPFYCQL